MKNLKNALVILFVSSLISSCTQVPIKNHLYCGDAGPLGATCFESQSDVTFDLSPSEWDEKRFKDSMICSSSQAYAEDTAAILKACRACRCCTYDAKQKLLKFQGRVKAYQKDHRKLQ